MHVYLYSNVTVSFVEIKGNYKTVYKKPEPNLEIDNHYVGESVRLLRVAQNQRFSQESEKRLFFCNECVISKQTDKQLKKILSSLTQHLFTALVSFYNFFILGSSLCITEL